MSINPESPGEIWDDGKGGRWLVVSLCHEPTVTMQAIEPVRAGYPPPDRKGGGISGFMWQGFRKIADAPASGAYSSREGIEP